LQQSNWVRFSCNLGLCSIEYSRCDNLCQNSFFHYKGGGFLWVLLEDYLLVLIIKDWNNPKFRSAHQSVCCAHIICPFSMADAIFLLNFSFRTLKVVAFPWWIGILFIWCIKKFHLIATSTSWNASSSVCLVVLRFKYILV